MSELRQLKKRSEHLPTTPRKLGGVEKKVRRMESSEEAVKSSHSIALDFLPLSGIVGVG